MLHSHHSQGGHDSAVLRRGAPLLFAAGLAVAGAWLGSARTVLAADDAPRAIVGGYGELHARLADDAKTAALDRLVLFVGSDLADGLKVETETEVEDGHEIEIEQAYLEWRATDRMQAQAGLVLLPISRLNLAHEPPTYLTVQRPGIDTAILPSTWREVGARVSYRISDAWSLDLAAINGLDAHGLREEDGFRGGRQNGVGAEAEAAEGAGTAVTRPAIASEDEEAGGIQLRDLATVARATWTPMLGASLAVAGYTSKAGQGDPRLSGVRGSLLSVDGDWDRHGWRLRGTAGWGFLKDADAVRLVTGEAVGSRFHGEALEAGYDVLHGRHTTSASRLIPYVRWEHLDPRSKAPAAAGTLASLATTTWTGGVTYFPNRQTALKAALVRTHAVATDETESAVELGLGWMF